MKIGFATTDFSFGSVGPDGGPAFGGAGFYRMFLPAEACIRAGHEVHWGGLISSNNTGELGVQQLEKLTWITPEHEAFPKNYGLPEAPMWEGRHHFDFDVIVMQRWMLQNTYQYVLKARAGGQVIVNDIDDWFWGLDPRNTAYLSSHPAHNKTSNRDHYLLTVMSSSVITVSTPFLADQLLGMFRELSLKKPPEVVVLRNMIDLERWRAPKRKYDPVTFGWVGAIPWRSGDVETLRGSLPKFLQSHPEVRFRHGGHMEGEGMPTFAQLAGVPADRVITSGMAPTYERMKLYYPIDVGLVPLNDLPFNHAKSAIKGMEYLAAGAPFIAPALPEYEWAAKLGMGMTIPRSGRPKEWSRALGRMLDPDTRAAELARGRAALEDQACSVRGVEWSDTYETAAGLVKAASVPPL